MSIDWQGLATQLGSIGTESDGTRSERGGASVARAALELLLTRGEVVGAVDHYVSLKPGFVPTFLADPDPGIQSWGIGVLDQLAFSDLVDAEEARPLIELALTHQNESVRRVARDIEERLEEAD